LEPGECGIGRTPFHNEAFAREATDAHQNAATVRADKQQSLEDQRIKRASR
jgi:hypothetical protein